MQIVFLTEGKSHFCVLKGTQGKKGICEGDGGESAEFQNDHYGPCCPGRVGKPGCET